MNEAVEAVHDLQLLHMTDYDGAWEGFAPGTPVEGADEASQQLVTVRSLKAILGIEHTAMETPSEPRVLGDDELAWELEETRTRVNELDDRRNELRDELRTVEEELGAVQPFVDLGLDLDLLSGYDSLAVMVGEGDPSVVRRVLAETTGVNQFKLFTGDNGALGIFAYTAGHDVDLADALVGAQFTGLEIPDVDSSPEGYVDTLRERKTTLQSKLETVNSEFAEVRAETASFLLAAEEQLAIDVQKREAPLSFATTENAFVAEGWIPSIRYDALVTALTDAVGDHVEIEKHGEAAYDDGLPQGEEEPVGEPVAADGGEQQPASDGGDDVAMAGGAPPVIQDNPDAVKPFEALVEVINRPKYDELDPTFIVFLTFPLFFGFMIGDLGYGILYMLIGGALMTQFDSDIVKSLGGVALWAGAFTAIFGILYGEFFGLHELGEIVWAGHPPIEKGLSPATSEFALLWLVVSLLIGLLHLTVGYVFDFYENLSHGLSDAVTESGSWVLMMLGIWVWVFADAPPTGAAPEILTGSESVLNEFIGFAGFSPTVGLAGIGVFVLGLALLVYAEPMEVVEFLDVLVNVLSYTRLAAVLLAKAGMAFVVNLLFFGVWVTESPSGAEWHFGLDHAPSYYVAQGTYEGEAVTGVLFEGLMHGGIAPVILGLVVLVIGHLLVLVLGVTSAGLQAVRLEYVEFFGKFYEGGGASYAPFGYERTYTTED
jgi:V/A-type H+-transporting ATPase subunit I